MKIRFVTAALLLASAPLYAAELIVTPVESKNGVEVAFDLVSEGDVAGVSFKLNVPGVKAGAKELGDCTAELPSGFEGSCKVHDGFVMVVANSASPDIALPAGVHPMGKISLKYAPGFDASAKGTISVERLEIADNSAKARPASVTMEK